ncbi:MAG: AI-2E family transporter, partial [Pyrinomonadaceae bacterium]|nr:AI-2E family transporter [Pyrinomonadaceae bacterium]
MALVLTLGLITALPTFIPNLGPIIASAPILLLAFMQGSRQAFYVLIVHSIIQFLEGNVLIPLVLQRAVSLPPALTITA